MSRSFVLFILLSTLTHVFFFTFSGLIVILPEKSVPPIRVTVIEPEPAADNIPISGRVEDLPAPEKEETPEKSKILSRNDSRGHSPEKGDKYQATKTAIPSERIDPATPALEIAKKEEREKSKAVSRTKVAALPRPEIINKKRPASRDLDLFSEEAIRKAIEPSNLRRFEKSDKPEQAKSRKLSTRITDRDRPPRPEADRASGTPDVKGAEISNYLMGDTDDVIDMGDEAVVSLNTKAFMYVDYFNSIKRAVELVWTYPEEAILSGASGRALIRFTLDKDGVLVDVRLLRSAGRKIFDDEALLAIKVAAPYKPFPASLNKKRLHIIGAFDYQPSFNAVQ